MDAAKFNDSILKPAMSAGADLAQRSWSTGGALAMLRVAVIVLAILASYDHYAYNGRFASVAVQASTSILQHFRAL
jgi:hypothetical protein